MHIFISTIQKNQRLIFYFLAIGITNKMISKNITANLMQNLPTILNFHLCNSYEIELNLNYQIKLALILYAQSDFIAKLENKFNKHQQTPCSQLYYTYREHKINNYNL